jgi:hypothetical protein
VKAAADGVPGDWHEFVTPESHIRAPNPGSVTAEGGGTTPPTLGGGTGFTRDTSTVAARGAREAR